MNTLPNSLGHVDLLLRRAGYVHWHRQQSKQHILRSQQGFNEVTPSRPQVCQGCLDYHGVAYGCDRATRTVLICAIHPKGWLASGSCPDHQQT